MKILLITESEKNKELDTFCKSMKVSIKYLKTSDYHKSVGFLTTVPGVSAKALKDSDNDVGKMIVMSGFTMEEMDIFTDELRNSLGYTEYLKAITTPYNLSFSIRALYSELVKEHSRI